jgi:hypothetical protein
MTEGVGNVGVGASALRFSEVGSDNTAIGIGAAQNSTGNSNTAVGSGSLDYAGSNNTAVGFHSLEKTTGSRNVALGYHAGGYETGDDSLYIDNQNRTDTAGDKAKALLYGTFAATAAAQQLTINAGTITLNGSAVTAASYAGAGTGLTGTAASLTAGNVTTNANLTGHVTSVGNAAVLGSFTMAQLSTAVSDGDPAYVGAANTFTTGQTISSTTSLLLGTAGSAVGNVGFRNATSGTTTLAPATGALGTGTVTLPLSGTLATLAGTEAFTGKTYEGNTLTTGTGTLTLSTFTLTAATTGTVFTSGTKADVLDAACFAADAGANDTYTATLSPAITAYVTGAHYRFKANTANTGAATINLNSLGAKTIVKAAGGITTALSDNDIRAGQWVDLVYDGTNMQMQSTLGNAASGGSGAVVAVKSATKTDTQTTTSPIGTAWVDITGLSITYTPTSASNKILISLSLQGSTDSATIMFVRVVRDGTLVGVADTAGSRTKVWSQGYETNVAVVRSICNEFLDAPADTSSHTWKVQFCTHSTAGTACVNRTSTDADNSAYGRAISTLTIMEVTP